MFIMNFFWFLHIFIINRLDQKFKVERLLTGTQPNVPTALVGEPRYLARAFSEDFNGYEDNE
jgi:hypothetical protein